jgi:hypothetical protein
MRTAMLGLAVWGVSCGGAMTQEAKENLTNAAKTAAAAYRYQDASTPAAALMRASFCSDQAALVDEKLPTIDAGIACQ